ncbi:MAG: HD domain-containing protein, partial [Candidatus Paceibacteria bacterium]
MLEHSTFTLKQELSQALNQGPKRYSENELKTIEAAFSFADLAHKDQRRLTGEPYIDHSLRVAKRLAELGLDTPSIVAALLHDIPDYSSKSLKDIESIFGGEVMRLV